MYCFKSSRLNPEDNGMKKIQQPIKVKGGFHYPFITGILLFDVIKYDDCLEIHGWC